MLLLVKRTLTAIIVLSSKKLRKILYVNLIIEYEYENYPDHIKACNSYDVSCILEINSFYSHDKIPKCSLNS